MLNTKHLAFAWGLLSALCMNAVGSTGSPVDPLTCTAGTKLWIQLEQNGPIQTQTTAANWNLKVYSNSITITGATAKIWYGKQSSESKYSESAPLQPVTMSVLENYANTYRGSFSYDQSSFSNTAQEQTNGYTFYFFCKVTVTGTDANQQSVSETECLYYPFQVPRAKYDVTWRTPPQDHITCITNGTNVVFSFTDAQPITGILHRLDVLHAGTVVYTTDIPAVANQTAYSTTWTVGALPAVGQYTYRLTSMNSAWGISQVTATGPMWYDVSIAECEWKTRYTGPKVVLPTETQFYATPWTKVYGPAQAEKVMNVQEGKVLAVTRSNYQYFVLLPNGVTTGPMSRATMWAYSGGSASVATVGTAPFKVWLTCTEVTVQVNGQVVTVNNVVHTTLNSKAIVTNIKYRYAEGMPWKSAADLQTAVNDLKISGGGMVALYNSTYNDNATADLSGITSPIYVYVRDVGYVINGKTMTQTDPYLTDVAMDGFPSDVKWHRVNITGGTNATSPLAKQLVNPVIDGTVGTFPAAGDFQSITINKTIPAGTYSYTACQGNILPEATLPAEFKLIAKNCP